jgi:hypothetical protein
MIVPRNLDLDWLHTAVQLLTSGRYRHRREGKTVAYLMLMLGEAELGGLHNNYLYVGQSAMFTSRVQKEFIDIVSATLPYEDVQHIRNKVSVNAQQYFFHPIETLVERPELIKGYSLDRIFMDRKLDGLFRTLLPQLSYRRGDVI